MRNYKNLKAFKLSDELTILVYTATKSFPKEEMFGLTNQLRRASVSVVCNIVEGCSRATKAEYLHFLSIAYGSACEVEYQLSLAFRLGYIDSSGYAELHRKSEDTCKTLNALICSLRSLAEP